MGEQPDWVKVVDKSLFHCQVEFNLFLCAVEVVVKKEVKQASRKSLRSSATEQRCTVLVVNTLCHYTCRQDE